MAVINQEGFARKIVEYHLNSERSEEWFHPMFIERHVGFTGNYEPIIHKAGIKKEKGCYLEAEL